MGRKLKLHTKKRLHKHKQQKALEKKNERLRKEELYRSVRDPRVEEIMRGIKE